MSFLENVKNAFKLKGGINGLKMVIGAGLVVLSHQLGAVHDLAAQIPALAPKLQSASDALGIAIGGLTTITNWTGNASLFYGAWDKVKKLFGTVGTGN